MAKDDKSVSKVQAVSSDVVKAAVLDLQRKLKDARVFERVAEREYSLGKIGNLTPIELERLQVNAREARSKSRGIAKELSLLQEALEASGA